MVLKRKFSILITMFVCLFALVGLTSCGGNNANSNVPEEPEDKYTETERNFVDALEFMLMDSLKDPSSLKITRILKSYCGGKVIAFSCTASNSFGGTVSSDYIIITKAFELEESMVNDIFMDNDVPFGTMLIKGYFVDYSLATDFIVPNSKAQEALQMIVRYNDDINEDSELNITVANVNELLTEYKKSQGWA